MRIAISTKGGSKESELDPSFGRTRMFLLFDTENRAFTAHDNTGNWNAAQGAGIQAAQSVIQLGATAVITGQVGPKAFQALKAGGVQIFLAQALNNVADAIEAFENGNLAEASSETKQGH